MLAKRRARMQKRRREQSCMPCPKFVHGMRVRTAPPDRPHHFTNAVAHTENGGGCHGAGHAVTDGVIMLRYAERRCRSVSSGRRRRSNCTRKKKIAAFRGLAALDARRYPPMTAPRRRSSPLALPGSPPAPLPPAPPAARAALDGATCNDLSGPLSTRLTR